MSSSDMAVETGLVLFVGVIQDTTAYETSHLHVSKKKQTVPWRQIASVHCGVGKLANNVRVEHTVPVKKRDVLITEAISSTLNESHKNRGNNCDTPRSLSCDRLEDQWFGALISVMRRPGSAGAPRPARKRHTHWNTHTQRGGVSPPQIHGAQPSRSGRPLACAHSSLLCLLLDFGTPWRDAPSSTYRPRRRPPQKPASSADQLPPHRTISKPSVTCTDSLLHVYSHTLHSPLHWCSHHQHASNCKR